MKSEILFISDLHIGWDKPEITRKFLDFLANRTHKAADLYILGDLFDAWVGDDDFSPPSRKIRQALTRLVSSGTRVFMMTGNRDFLLGRRFCEETGVTLLGDTAVIDLFGTRTLLTHGDLLCTDDLPYQAFRIKSRSTEWQGNVLSKPLLLRLLAARWYRLRSYFHKRNKTQEIMDVNQSTVIDIMRKHRCHRLIHGHTHRPNIHDFEIDGIPAQRFVLADWSSRQGQTLIWNSQGYRVEAF